MVVQEHIQTLIQVYFETTTDSIIAYTYAQPNPIVPPIIAELLNIIFVCLWKLNRLIINIAN
jgi:hypothetical protein